MSDKELKCQLSGIIKTCAESLIFLKMVKIGRKNIRGHYLPNILATQNVPFNKGLSSPSEYLLRKNFHQRLDNIKNSQNNLKSDFLKTKSQKIWNYFKKEKKTVSYNKGYNTNNGIQRKGHTKNFHIKQDQGNRLHYYRKYQFKSKYKCNFESKYSQYQSNSLPITHKKCSEL